VRQVRAFLFPRSDAATKMNFESAMRPTVLVFAMLLAAFAVEAQTLQTLCFFNNTNGAWPEAALTPGADGNFYGTTWWGGSSYNGTVFKVTTNGTLTSLASFNGFSGAHPEDGANPQAALTLGNDGNFYGTTSGGGNGDFGTVFKMTTNGTLTTLVVFNGTNSTLLYYDGTNGAYPRAALTLGTDGNLYGTTYGGITNSTYLYAYGMGTVFKVTTNGTLSGTTLVVFNGTNGAFPDAALTLGNDGNFYGTTQQGGSSGGGTVFKVTTNGTLTTLVNFNGTNGASPQAALTLGTDGNFYGTTYYGGGNSGGTVFKVTTNGTLTTLVSFSFNGNSGANPNGLTLGKDGNLYGTTVNGGSSGGNGGGGTLFKMTTNGTLTTLVNFRGTDGWYPYAALTLGADGNLYGTTYDGSSGGGSSGYGTVFRLLLPPPSLTLQLSAGCPLLNLTGMLSNNFVVQYSTNLSNTNWINLLSVTNLSSSPCEFLDSAGSGQPARFYRAVQLH